MTVVVMNPHLMRVVDGGSQEHPSQGQLLTQPDAGRLG
jgi:hypothetical protein